MTIYEAAVGKTYIIRQVNTPDAELNNFLFSLGCYSGEQITVNARRKSGCTVTIKNARYSIDIPLAKAIAVEGV